MYYIRECTQRLWYSLISYIVLLLIIYVYYPWFFATINEFYSNIVTNCGFSSYYIYTHPLELYLCHIYFSFLLSINIIFPYIIWQIVDFIKPALYATEYNKLVLHLRVFSAYLLLCLYFFYTFCLPYLLNSLYFMKNFYEFKTYILFFELKISDFIDFITTTHFLICIFIISLYLFVFLILHISIKTVIKFKRIVYGFILVLVTFLTPPDWLSQVVVLALIVCIIEVLLYIQIFRHLLKCSSSREKT